MKLRSSLAVLGAVGLLASCGSSAPRSAPPPSAAQAGPTASTAASSTSAPPSAPAAAWVTYGHDAGRSGLDPSAPQAGSLHAAWTSTALDGAIYAQPLVVGSSVIVATENDTVYSLSAATGVLGWSRHLGTPVDGATLACGNISPSGITGTPVADPATGALWVVIFRSSAPGRSPQHLLWSLDLSTGAVTSQQTADPPGSDPRAEQQRGALALANSRVYVPYGGLYSDCSDYHGWVMGYPAARGTAASIVSFETPTVREAGIWAPPGPVVASDGSLYVATGNGTPTTAIDDSDSVVRLSPTLQVEATFTPSNYATLSAGDLDLGSTSPALVAGGLVFQVGKEGVGYVLAAGHLGGLGGQLSSAQVCQGGFGGDAVDGDVVVVSCFEGLYAVRITPEPLAHPGLAVVWKASGTRPGPPVLAGGLVWVVDRGGALTGYDATTGAVRARSSVTVSGSFPTLAAANGRLFVPSGDRIAAYQGA